ncbi:cytochrome c, partial [Thioclava sp. BHET1]
SLWNMDFGASPGFNPIPGASADVNRGAYLVEGLGHCGSCHTPRGFAMQEKAYTPANTAYLSGGDLNGWTVPPLRGASSSGPGVQGWTEQDIVDYLGGGRNRFAAVGGEMTSAVEHSTSHMTDADLKAVAAFLKTLKP